MITYIVKTRALTMSGDYATFMLSKRFSLSVHKDEAQHFATKLIALIMKKRIIASEKKTLADMLAHGAKVVKEEFSHIDCMEVEKCGI